MHAGVDDRHAVTAAAPVAPVGAAERLELLPVHRGASVAARAGGGGHHRTVDEPRHCRSLRFSSHDNGGPPAGGAAPPGTRGSTGGGPPTPPAPRFPPLGPLVTRNAPDPRPARTTGRRPPRP